MKNFLVVIVASFLFQLISSAPTESSLVVLSTEPTTSIKENADDLQGPATTLVIYEMNVTANVSNRFCRSLIVSKVKNPEKTASEATFTVILPEKAFISEFVMEIGEKNYKAYVKEKEEAQYIYQQAVASGQTAAHVAVNARDSHRFTVSVNVESEAKATFLLRYEELLERKDNQYELVLNIHPGQIVKNLNVEVYINESKPLQFVRTPSLRTGNEITKNDDKLNTEADIKIIDGSSAVVKFTPDTEKQKQFAQGLGIKESVGLSGQFVVQYDVERDTQGGELLFKDGYFVHFFAPKGLEPLPKHVVFVLDVSGSMEGVKIEQLKDAMINILGELNSKDVLSIVAFSHDSYVWDITTGKVTSVVYYFQDNFYTPFDKLRQIDFPSPVPATPENIEKAKSVIKKIRSFGETHMIGGLETALYLVKREQVRYGGSAERHQPIIMFLTDGLPNGGISSTEEITNIVTKLNSEHNHAPIFALSFGAGADKDFLKKLALQNFGFSRHIYDSSDASLQLQEFYKQISSPLLSNIKFKYEADVDNITRNEFPLYFGGSELVVTGKYQDTPSPTVVECVGPEGSVHLQPIVQTPVTSLERLWAYLTVKQILDQRDSSENKEELTKKALDLSLLYSFVTDVTSLVVVKPNSTDSADIVGAAKREPELPEYTILTTTIRPFAPPTTTVEPYFEDTIPWFIYAINTNRTISLPQGTFELGNKSTSIVGDVACPNTPLDNNQAGICTLIKDCPEVHSLLIDLQVYEQYFCAINRFAGVCCPKKI